jgi:hypothetical protein
MFRDSTNLFLLFRRAVVVHVHVLDSLTLALAVELGVDLLVFGVGKDGSTGLGSGLVLVGHDCGCLDGYVGVENDGLWLWVAESSKFGK